MFNDMSNVVLNDDAVADGRKCHADCALIHELCMEKGNMNGGKCAEMQCGVFGDKVGSSGEGSKGVLICWCSVRDARCVGLEGLGSEQRLPGFGTRNLHDRGRAG
jgi:hypothetical protein